MTSQKSSTGILLTGAAALVAVIALALRIEVPGGTQQEGAVTTISTAPPRPHLRFASESLAIAGHNGGCLLIARFLGGPVGTDSCPTSIGVSPRRAGTTDENSPFIRFLLATIPDPYESHLDWLYDGNLDAIRRAFALAGYVPDSYYLPGPDDTIAVVGSAIGTPKDDRGRSVPRLVLTRTYHPGILLFRAESSRLPPSAPHLWAVYIVPELPTTGINKAAFKAALVDRSRLLRLNERRGGEDTVVRVLGPTFSGSGQSLLVALSSNRGRLAKGSIDVEVVTGSATSLDTKFRRAKLPRSRLHFRSMVNSDATMQSALQGLLNRLDIKEHEVAVLSEAQTSYGATSVLDDYLRISFPLNIASLRAEFDRSTEALEDAAELPGLGSGPRTAVSLVSPQKPRESPPVTSRLTIPAVDVIVRDMERTLTLRGTKLVVLVATDVRDKLMLMRALRRRMRDVIFVVFESNVLFLRPEYRHAVRGAFVISTYPLSLENEAWQYCARLGPPQTARDSALWKRTLTLPTFASDVSLGTFNAVLTHIGEPAQRRQFAPPGFDDNEAKMVPPTWVTAVGNDVFLPLYFTYPTNAGLDYFSSRDSTSAHVIRRMSLAALQPSPVCRQGQHFGTDVLLGSIAIELTGRPDASVSAVALDTLIATVNRHVQRGRPESAPSGSSLAVLIPIAAFVALGMMLLAPLGLREMGPDSLRPASTKLELIFAALFVTAAFCALLPVMAQIQLEATLWPQQAPTLWHAFGRLTRQNAVGIAIAAALAPMVLGMLTWRSVKDAPAIRWTDGSDTAGYVRERLRDMEWYREFMVNRLAPAVIVLWVVAYTGATAVWSLRVAGLCGNRCADAALFTHRATDLFSGGSPVMVVVLLALALALWAKWQLDVTRDLKRPAAFEVALKEVGRQYETTSSLRTMGHDMWRCRATFVDLIPDESALRTLVVLVAAVMAAWQLKSFGNTLEDVALGGHLSAPFNWAIAFGLIALGVATAWGILRLTSGWQTLQTFLDLFAKTRLTKVFGAIPTDVVRAARPALWGEHSWSAPGFGIRPHVLSLDAAKATVPKWWTKLTVRLRSVTASSGGTPSVDAASIAADNPADISRISTRDTDFRPRVMDVSEAVVRRLPLPGQRWANDGVVELASLRNAAVLVERLGYFDEEGDEVAAKQRSSFRQSISPSTEAAVSTWMALEVAFFVARAMFVMRRLALTLVVSLLLAVLVTATYPFQAQSLLRWSVTGLMVFALASLLTVIMRMSSNTVLRQVTQQEDGSSLGATAAFNLMVFAVIPLIGFLATEIPVVRSFLVAWVEPLTHALTK